jgi:cysteine desulfurase
MIYLDNQATTPLDPRALEAMMPLWGTHYANSGSVTHQAGRDVARMVDSAIAEIARSIGAAEDELVITSGATESNNLALLGVMHHPRQRRRKVVSLVTEHKAVLGPLGRLRQQGFDVQLLPVQNQDSELPGVVDLERLSQMVDDQTALVSIMLANNEIGSLQPVAQIAAICRQAGCYLHTDASQALGRLPVDVDELDVDLLSFSAHKFYGPKGVGGLYVRRRGQQHNLRSGTLNTAGIIGMQVALSNSLANLVQDQIQIGDLREQLYQRLKEIPELMLNGPPLRPEVRLGGNLNCCFYPLEGQSLMLLMPDLAVSSGSACTSADPEPSHVLQAIGLTEDQARSSLRFGIGRLNTSQEIDQAADWLIAAANKLRSF